MATPEIAFRDIYNELTPPPMMSFGEPLPPVAQALENIQALIDDGKGQKLSFELEVKHDPVTGKGGFTLHTEKMTAQAGIEQTRFLYLLQESHEMYLVVPETNELLKIIPDPLSEDELKTLIYRARVFRKLRFLELVLGVEFPIPPVMSNNNIATIDTVFRGITRGNVFSTMDSVTLVREDITVDDIDFILQNADTPVSFERIFTLFDIFVPVGTVLGIVMDPKPGNASELSTLADKMRAGKRVESATIILKSCSDQVAFHFRDQLQRMKASRQQALDFLKTLSESEPEELARQVLFPMTGEVKPLEVAEIAMAHIFLVKNPETNLTINVVGYDVSTDPEYWVVQLALIDKNRQEDEGDLALVFVNRYTGMVHVPQSVEEVVRLVGESLPTDASPRRVDLQKYGTQESEERNASFK